MSGMSKGWLVVPVAAAVVARMVFAAEVSSIDFRLDNGKTVIEITGDQPIEYSSSENGADKQIVIDLKGSTLSTVATRKLDTSSFESPVRLVSPYSVEGDSRIVLQLSEMTTPSISAEGNVIKVEFESTGAGVDTTAATAEIDVPSGDLVSDSGTQAPNPKFDLRDESQFSAFDAAANGKFKGKSITINVREAEVRDVLRLIGDASGFNLIVGTDVEGKVSLQLEDVPWDQVLNVVLKTMQLGAERSGNVLRVMTIQNLTREKQAELTAKQAAEASAPKVTRVFPISYAVPGELMAILATFGSSSGADAGGASPSSARLSVDTRTNSIVVQALPEEIDRMQKLIAILDTETPQVLIEAKIVEATEQFSKGITGNIGLGGSRFGASFNGGNNLIDGLVGTVDLSGGGEATTNSGTIGVSPSVSFLPGIQKINAQINLAEQEAIAKVISSPRIVVLNNKQADIRQDIPTVREITTPSIAGPIISFEQVNGQLSLGVTPQVTNDERVLMQLNISRDVIIPSTLTDMVAARNLTTNVLVESGSTLVIGGLYTFDNRETKGGFPVLKDIPILGILFGSSGSQNNRTELFVFISPRILNSSAAGLEG